MLWHNLESSRRFFPEHCTTHSFTIASRRSAFLKRQVSRFAVVGLSVWGIREDRCDLALELRAIGASVAPVNFLNPIDGTPYENMEALPPMEILKTVARFRFLLPDKEIMVAGGRTINLRDLQSMIFMAGASIDGWQLPHHAQSVGGSGFANASRSGAEPGLETRIGRGGFMRRLFPRMWSDPQSEEASLPMGSF